MNSASKQDQTEDADMLRRSLVQKLESLRRGGVLSIPRPAVLEPATIVRQTTEPARASAAETMAAASVTEPATATSGVSRGGPSTTSTSTPSQPRLPTETWSSPALPAEARLPALEVLAQEVSACTLCSELAEKRTQTVFGVGNPNARLVFFGEAPGADEDRLGEPFVGKAGQLLTKIIEACKLRREDVYILNVLKCRPPGNRNPAPSEATNCRPFFERQLEIIRPEVICCLGSIAATTLLETNQSVGRLRGSFHAWKGIPVAVTYHPAYLLRTPAAKKNTWTDMKMVMRKLGVEL